MMKLDDIKKNIDKLAKFKDLILVFPLSILILRIFFSQRRASAFDIVALVLLLIWKYGFNRKPLRTVPNYVVIAVILYMTSDLIGALLSYNQYWELTELRKYVHVFIGGLLFTTPMDERIRKILIVFFFSAAAVIGFEGIRQHVSIGIRSIGSLPHPILYAEILALACGSAVIMVFSRDKIMSGSKTGLLFLLIALFITSGGILFSESRGVWVALLVAVTVTLSLHSRQKTLIFLFSISAILIVALSSSAVLRAKATSIVTSIYTENETGSTGTRMELWKGALLIFRESPLLGAGTGNFEPNIKRLVLEGKLKETPTTVHAHNIFLQALATRGIIGFAILVSVFTALIKWGLTEIHKHKGMGGYIIVFTTILTIVGGLTEDNLGTIKYLSAYCFTTGLLGSSEII